VLLLSGCTSSSPISDAPPESGVASDGGGNIFAYAAFALRLNASDPSSTFVAPKRCSSACTVLLAPFLRDDVCFPADGVLRFHSASLRGPVDPDVVIEQLNQLLASHYPPRLAKWFLEEGPGRTRSVEFVAIPVSELAARGELTVCGS
jgi:hypothetical protein